MQMQMQMKQMAKKISLLQRSNVHLKQRLRQCRQQQVQQIHATTATCPACYCTFKLKHHDHDDHDEGAVSPNVEKESISPPLLQLIQKESLRSGNMRLKLGTSSIPMWAVAPDATTESDGKGRRPSTPSLSSQESGSIWSTDAQASIGGNWDEDTPEQQDDDIPQARPSLVGQHSQKESISSGSLKFASLGTTTKKRYHPFGAVIAAKRAARKWQKRVAQSKEKRSASRSLSRSPAPPLLQLIQKESLRSGSMRLQLSPHSGSSVPRWGRNTTYTTTTTKKRYHPFGAVIAAKRAARKWRKRVAQSKEKRSASRSLSRSPAPPLLQLIQKESLRSGSMRLQLSPHSGSSVPRWGE